MKKITDKEEIKRFKKFIDMIMLKQKYHLGIKHDHLLYPTEFFKLWPLGESYYTTNRTEVFAEITEYLYILEKAGWITEVGQPGILVFSYKSLIGYPQQLKEKKDLIKQVTK